MRCMTDNRLMTENLCRLGFCAGHYLKQPAYPNVFQYLLFKIGLYEPLCAWYWNKQATWR